MQYQIVTIFSQGSTIVREHNIDVELQSSREQLKSSIQLAWSQVSHVLTQMSNNS